jgi:ankyrin repeat protein
MLLNKGYKINDIDSNHGTALQAAIYMNDTQDTAVINSLLDENKAEVNTAGGCYGCALQVAAFKGSESLIKRLLSHGADVGTCGGKYGSVLQAAARTGLPSIVDLILGKVPEERQGAFVNLAGGVYGSALQAAAKGDYTGQTRFLRSISRGRVLGQETKVSRKASTDQPDYVKVAEILIAKGAKVKYNNGGRFGSPIGAAAKSGDLQMLKLLVGHDVKTTTKEQRRKPYSHALINAITQDAVPENRLPLVKLLVEAGADVDFETGSGLDNRPLTAAAAINATTVLEYLLEKTPDRKATINADSGIYGTALRAALSAKKENAAIYLIGQGAGINTLKDEIYGNILHLAAFSKMDQVVELLLGNKYRMSVNLRDEVGQTALHIAAYRGFRSTVSILLQHKADPDLEDAWGDTPRKIAEDVTERESHPGPSLEDLRDISHQLLVASAAKLNKRSPSDLVHGPPIWMKPKASLTEQGTAKRVFASPTWNPGLGFKATISDFLQKDGDEYISIKSLLMDDLLYRKGAVDELMNLEDSKYTKNLRWYHIPSNNMTWAHMLIKILWAKRHPNTACKSFWGTDPYFVSPDLAPHARFVTPQCERLIPDAFEEPTKFNTLSTDNTPLAENRPTKDNEPPADNQPPKENQSPKDNPSSQPPKTTKTPKITERGQNTLFLAMPYLHWESYRSSEAVSQLLKNIKDRSMQNLILRGSKSWRTYEAEPRALTRSTVLDSAKQKEEPAGMVTHDKKSNSDDELMEKYLFKRLPVHLRRTLDQYYYSYLADTRVRDRDQVVTKVRNRELYNHTHISHTVEKKTSKSKRFGRSKDVIPENLKNETPPPDNNSPLVVVDQLWLWVLDRG